MGKKLSVLLELADVKKDVLLICEKLDGPGSCSERKELLNVVLDLVYSVEKAEREIKINKQSFKELSMADLFWEDSRANKSLQRPFKNKKE